MSALPLKADMCSAPGLPDRQPVGNTGGARSL